MPQVSLHHGLIVLLISLFAGTFVFSNETMPKSDICNLRYCCGGSQALLTITGPFNLPRLSTMIIGQRSTHLFTETDPPEKAKILTVITFLLQTLTNSIAKIRAETQVDRS